MFKALNKNYFPKALAFSLGNVLGVMSLMNSLIWGLFCVCGGVVVMGIALEHAKKIMPIRWPQFTLTRPQFILTESTEIKEKN